MASYSPRKWRPERTRLCATQDLLKYIFQGTTRAAWRHGSLMSHWYGSVVGKPSPRRRRTTADTAVAGIACAARLAKAARTTGILIDENTGYRGDFAGRRVRPQAA